MNYLAVISALIIGMFVGGCGVTAQDRRDSDQTPVETQAATIEEKVYIISVKMEDDDGKIVYYDTFYSYHEPRTDWETGELLIDLADSDQILRVPVEFEWLITEGTRSVPID